jgi:hypothetical protein
MQGRAREEKESSRGSRIMGLIRGKSGRRGESTNGTGRDEDDDECGMHARSRGRGRTRRTSVRGQGHLIAALAKAR